MMMMMMMMMSIGSDRGYGSFFKLCCCGGVLVGPEEWVSDGGQEVPFDWFSFRDADE